MRSKRARRRGRTGRTGLKKCARRIWFLLPPLRSGGGLGWGQAANVATPLINADPRFFHHLRPLRQIAFKKRCELGARIADQLRAFGG